MNGDNQAKPGPDGVVVAIGKPGAEDSNALSEASNVDTVPLDFLAMPDDSEQMQPPEVGDEVNYQVTGKVVAIEGNSAKVERTSINGQDLPGQDDDDSDNGQGDEQSGDDNEAQGLRDQAGGMPLGALGLFILLLSLFLGRHASAQNSSISTPPAIGWTSIGAKFTNSFVIAPAEGTRIYNIQGYNSNATPVVVMFFQTNGVPANGAPPLYLQQVAALSTYKFDFGSQGCVFDAGTVCVSTTTNTLTLAANTVNVTMVSIQSAR